MEEFQNLNPFILILAVILAGSFTATVVAVKGLIETGEQLINLMKRMNEEHLHQVQMMGQWQRDLLKELVANAHEQAQSSVSWEVEVEDGE